MLLTAHIQQHEIHPRLWQAPSASVFVLLYQ